MRYVCLVYFDPGKVFGRSGDDLVLLNRDSGAYGGDQNGPIKYLTPNPIGLLIPESMSA